MERILISWIAASHDFTKEESDGINRKGTHFELYKHAHNTFDRHYLLVSEHEGKIKTKHDRLKNLLNINYRGKTELIPMDISDVINVGMIKQKVTPFLISLGQHPIDIFISPGTPAMQVVWYMIAAEFNNVNIFQTRPNKYRQQHTQDIREFIHVEKTGFANALLVQEVSAKNKTKESDPSLLITSSQELAFNQAVKIAPYNIATVIYGESGTGKEIIARHIHKHSNRSGKFRALNCACVTDTLIESTLFGHKKGSFTSANTTEEGLFLSANGGTVFLDEIGDASPKLQQSLLRVLQESTVKKVGSPKEEKIDVRFIFATHKNLWEKVKAKTFRLDLFYRIHIAELYLPPFKIFEPSEKQQWIDFFLEKEKDNFHKSLLKIDKAVNQHLLEHEFPGNIRELQNLIKKFYTYFDTHVDSASFNKMHWTKRIVEKSLSLDSAKATHIKYVLDLFRWHKTKTAKALGIRAQALNANIKKYNIDKSKA